MLKLSFIPLILFLCCFSCDLTELNIENLEETELTQAVYFECEYQNNAWGQALYGKYIDGEGNIYSYRYDHNNVSWQPGDKRDFTETEILSKFNSQKELVATVDTETLGEKAALIGSAVNSQMSEVLNQGADMGQTSYICYYLNEEGNYVPVILETTGDNDYHKTSQDAIALVEWLKSLGL